VLVLMGASFTIALDVFCDCSWRNSQSSWNVPGLPDYFIVLMSSLLFYNVENSKNKETLEWTGMFKHLTVNASVGQRYLFLKNRPHNGPQDLVAVFQIAIDKMQLRLL
jgi:hypothetical protein